MIGQLSAGEKVDDAAIAALQARITAIGQAAAGS